MAARLGLRRLAAAAAGVALAAAGWAAVASPPRERTVELVIRHSRFSPAVVETSAGERLRLVVRNLDPIAHELIVGPMDVQLRHESGREAWHPPVPGEVSVAMFSTAQTTYTVGEDAPVLLGCHLPGHWDYGMQGRIALR